MKYINLYDNVSSFEEDKVNLPDVWMCVTDDERGVYYSGLVDKEVEEEDPADLSYKMWYTRYYERDSMSGTSYGDTSKYSYELHTSTVGFMTPYGYNLAGNMTTKYGNEQYLDEPYIDEYGNYYYSKYSVFDTYFETDNFSYQTYYYLKSVEFEDGLKVLKENCFIGGDYFTKLVLPNTLKKIESGCFNGCGSLNDITYNGTKSEWNKVIKEDNWHGSIPSGTVIKCSDGDVNVY